jgi:AcrR family transcriptional regulator
MHSTTGRTVRERLLAAADELFYSEGVQTVGVDRITKRAGASKKSLYTAFGSKEALVGAYLEARRISIEDGITQGLARLDTPRERLLGAAERRSECGPRPLGGCRGSSGSRRHFGPREDTRSLKC